MSRQSRNYFALASPDQARLIDLEQKPGLNKNRVRAPFRLAPVGSHSDPVRREFVYNANDRMSQVKQAGVVKASYRYNAKGERVSRADNATGAITGYTLYDEAGHWIGDYDANGGTKQQAIWLGDAPVGLVVGAGVAQTLRYVQPDHLGTPRAVIDPSRNLAVWTWDAKGEAFGNNPPNQDPDQDGTAFVFDMRFPGQKQDPEWFGLQLLSRLRSEHGAICSERSHWACRRKLHLWICERSPAQYRGPSWVTDRIRPRQDLV